MACNLRLAVVSPVSRHESTSDIAPYGLLDMNRLHSAWNQSILDCFAERHPALLALVPVFFLCIMMVVKKSATMFLEMYIFLH